MTLYAKLKLLLLDAGLSEAEAEIYINLAKSPADNSYELVNRTGFNRSTIYRSIEKLKSLKLVTKNENGLKANSLKSLVSELKTSSLKLNKTAHKIQSIAPFLRTPKDSIEKFEHFYTKDQIAEAYLFMSEQNYSTNLDFGDFESFVPTIKGQLSTAYKFRNNRVKHASHHAICTTFGAFTSTFCTKESKAKFKNQVSFLNADFRNRFIIFSDNSDYVLFNNFTDQENPFSVLIKSKIVADAQRAQFDIFSQKVENL
jgi:Fe2+ or Zn2+ uptake regulation protein